MGTNLAFDGLTAKGFEALVEKSQDFRGFTDSPLERQEAEEKAGAAARLLTELESKGRIWRPLQLTWCRLSTSILAK